MDVRTYLKTTVLSLNSRVRLVLPAGILLAGAGSSLSSVTNFSTPSLFFGGGGAVNFLCLNGEAGIVTQELELETEKPSNLSSKEYRNRDNFSLASAPQVLELQHQVETQKSQSSVVNIFREAKKEVKVRDIERQSISQARTTSAGVTAKDYQGFKSGVDKVRGFRAGTSNIQKLSIEEKKIISDFFSKFEHLDRESQKYFEELEKVQGESREAQELTKKLQLSTYVESLQKIGFFNQDLNLFEKQTSFKPNKMNSHYHYSANRAPDKNKAKSTWGSWMEQHPYYSFFEEEGKWLGAVDKISDAWKSYYSYMNNSSRTAISFFSMGSFGAGDKGKLEKAIDDAKAELELQIGTKLMNIMKRS
ncbi:hypothetical protein [Candidatus Mycoplasma haematominutum]|uniref:Uncharacterized protein n=1 Tax=Candidatus Mycoplasma haematominutum 'Birmingham 1' TaxID=1116213 RepID=G8C3J4_9MOLU|nr:hypothetical protein [Candidatus Mycoplasma haematominutum]CCE66892.1 hypothetical protein MHM_03740 [Candidatus Mycoplasma haematominutum 'Birmingham 1']